MFKYLSFVTLAFCCTCCAIAELPTSLKTTETSPPNLSIADTLPNEILAGLDQIPSGKQELKDIILPNGYNAEEFLNHFEKGASLGKAPRKPLAHSGGDSQGSRNTPIK